MSLRLVAACLLSVGVLAHAAHASAALTDSEKGQLRSFFEAADLSTVSRMRALCARPDLTEPEATEALTSSLRDHPLTPARERYLHELLLGPASQASRAPLLGPLAGGLLARADQLLRDRAGSMAGMLDTDPAAYEELLRIHQFMARSLAPGAAVTATLRNHSLRSVAQAYGRHVTSHAELLGHRNKAEGRALLLRSQVALNLSLLASQLSNREEIADWLVLDPEARGFFLRTGAVLETSAQGVPPRAAQAARLVESQPGALREVRLVLIDKVTPAALQPGAAVLAIRAGAGAEAPLREGWFSGSPPEQLMAEAAWATASRATTEALQASPRIAELADGALQRAAGRGEAAQLAPWLISSSLDRDASTLARPVRPSMLATAAAAMLLVDGRRTFDLALGKWLAREGYLLEQAVLGLSVLRAASGDEVMLGVRGGKGRIRSKTESADGVLTGFELDGYRWMIERSDTGLISRLRIDGREPGRWAISSTDAKLAAAERWAAGARDFTRLAGAPRVAVLEDGRVVLAASPSATAAEAIVSKGDGDVTSADLRIDAGEAGLLVRATPSQAGLEAVALVVSCDEQDACTAKLVQCDASGCGRDLASAAVGSQPARGFMVRLAVQGKRVRASIGATQLEGQLASVLKAGQAGLLVGPGGRMELRTWRIQEAMAGVQANRR